MSDAADAAVILRTIARMARDPSGEVRGDIAILAYEQAVRFQGIADARNAAINRPHGEAPPRGIAAKGRLL